jgi:fimbrial chaperone protein
MKLEPTNEVVFFPKFFTLDPGKAQKIRVGVVATPVSVEQSYRMFVEELPPVERPTPEAGSRVRVLTKMGIPIFVEPPEKKPAAAVGSPSLGEGTLRFSVENLGNVHFSLFGVRVRGLAADGSVAFERQAEGWYVLAKGRREYEMKLSPEECRQAVKVVVQAETDLGEVRGEATLDPTGCTSSGEGPSSRGGG